MSRLRHRSLPRVLLTSFALMWMGVLVYMVFTGKLDAGSDDKRQWLLENTRDVSLVEEYKDESVTRRIESRDFEMYDIGEEKQAAPPEGGAAAVGGGDAHVQGDAKPEVDPPGVGNLTKDAVDGMKRQPISGQDRDDVFIYDNQDDQGEGEHIPDAPRDPEDKANEDTLHGVNEQGADGQPGEEIDNVDNNDGDNNPVVHGHEMDVQAPEPEVNRDIDQDARNEPVVNEAPGYDPNGPGEMNKPMIVNVSALSAEQKSLYDAGWAGHGYNKYVGDLISVRRKLPDFREPGCLEYKYRPTSQLPVTSIVTLFNNEAWSTLLRTVHTCLDNSPPELIKDFILVDDFSDYEYLKQPLDDYMAKLGKVKVVHTTKREGSIRARILGAEAATGEVLMFLDAHCECTTGWLEPLLDRIADNRTNVLMPFIATISDEDYSVKPATSETVWQGGFDWNLFFNWHLPSPYEQSLRKKLTDPLRTPVQPGGIYAIERKYFFELGAFDPGFEIWGADNMELSFKIWMCGGRIEIVPCSHIGHIYRKFSPIKWETKGNKTDFDYNNRRLADVWMDEYKNYYYEQIQDYKPRDIGDISDRVTLRKNLRCNSFDWFMKNVYPDKFIPSTAAARGEVRNKKRSVCIQSINNAELKVENCWLGSIVTKLVPSHSQYWFLSGEGTIRQNDLCLDYAVTMAGPTLINCNYGDFQVFIYKETGQIYHKMTDRCLTVDETGTGLLMAPCTGDVSQQWEWHRP